MSERPITAARFSIPDHTAGVTVSAAHNPEVGERIGRVQLNNAHLRALLLLLLPCLLPNAAHAQAGFESISTLGQFRAAVIDEPGRSLYVAIYDRNEVARIDLDTREVLDQVEVGHGPVALSLSRDRSILAVANRISNTVSLLSAADLRVVSYIEVGEGPTAIGALPSGRFAVVNTYSDTLSIVNTESRSVEATLELEGSVPNSVSTSERFIAVGARVPPSVLLFDAESLQPLGSVSLDAAPTGLAFVKADRLAVSTKRSLSTVSVPSGIRGPLQSVAAFNVAATDDRLFAATTEGLREFDFALTEGASAPLPGSTRYLAASSSLIAALSPKNKTLYIRGTLEPGEKILPIPIAPDPVDVAPPPQAPLDEPIVEEAESIPAETPTPPRSTPPSGSPSEPVIEEAESIPSAPIEPELESAPDNSPEPEALAIEDIEDEPFQEPALPPAPSPPILPSTATDDMTPEQAEENLDRIRAIRRPDANAVGSLEPRAPYLSQPEGSLVDSANVSFRDALAGGTPFGDPTSGFIIPDAESLEGLELEINAGDFEGGIDEQGLFFSEGVEVRLGDMLILSETARRFTSDDDLETIEATGDVRFNQENAQGTADRLLIRLPSSEEESSDSLPAQLFPKPPEGEEGSQPARGYFEAENLHLLEPSRELDAKYIEYDLSKETGEMFHAHGRAGIFYWSAENLKILGPDEVEGEDVWFTTCDHDPPHYRIRLGHASLKEGQVVLGTNARLQLGKMNTPLFLPHWKSSGSGENRRVNYSFDSGRLAELGYFLNLARWWEVTPNVDMAFRVMPTQKEGVGFGTDIEFDFMERPASLLFRSKGEFRSMYTTEDRGYTEFYHRQELSPHTILLAQYEQWYDRDFVKDFFYDTYRDRTGPRTFVNLTHTRPGQILTAIASVSTHDFTRETEKLPELSYHLLERRLAKRLYLTFDSFSGYYDRTRSDDDAGRSVNTARLSYDWNIGQGIGITPFVEAEGTWYSETRDLQDDSDEYRFSGVAGITLQARLHRAYKGRWGFSGFKHIIVPSFTYSYRPDASLDSEDTPRLDALDDVPGRSRIEGKIDNIFLGRDEVLDEEWQIARVSFYHGNDFENETRKTQDYELEIDIRPRPWWGFQAVGEHHSIDRERDLLGYVPVVEALRDFVVDAQALLDDEEVPDERRGDFSRVLAYFYYDDSKNPGGMNGRLGFAYTETDNKIFNREVLYGLGYRVNDNWGFAFEHRYDLERDELVRQTYEVRRRLHDWEAAIQLRDRESGFDIGVEFTLTAFPGARLKF